LYDQPPKHFKRLSLDEIHSFWLELENENHNIKQISSKIGLETNSSQTLITQQDNDKNVEFRQNRPKVLISSTSWTIDEDFSILLDALKQYDNIQSPKSNPQHLVVIITGKGPLKEHYEELFESAGYRHSTVVTAWLSYDHYSKLLGSVDYGLSFHTSSSGLDLPMKVVDMLACSLPVLALNFNCLDELVTPDSQASYKFNNSEELFNHLKVIITNSLIFII
jgi:beta-1,4-mannosyltransferase